MFCATSDEIDSFNAIENQIEILEKANNSPTGIYDIIYCRETHEPITGEEDINLTVHQTWHLRQKITIILAALLIAKEQMELKQNWFLCCEQAICRMKSIGIASCVTNARTVMTWYCEFRQKRKLSVVKFGKRNLPPFLLQNPDVKNKIIQYARENIDQLSAEVIFDFVHDKILPALIDEQRNEDEIIECTSLEQKKR